MPNEITAAIARRYQFESWRGVSLLAQRLYLLNYAIRGDEIPRWDLSKVKPMRALSNVPMSGSPQTFMLGSAGRSAQTETRTEPVSILKLPLSPHGTTAGVPVHLPPAHTRAFWRSADLPDALLEAELHECSSITAAHEWLLNLLAVFESPLMKREEDPPMGDVCFSAPASTVFLFARGNMVLHVRNAGRAIVDVKDASKNLDASLIRKPKRAQRGARRARAGEAVEVRTFRPGARVLLDLGLETLRASPAASRLETTTWKVFYSDGEIEAGLDGLYFGSDHAGPHTLEVYTIEQGGGTQYRELRLESDG